MIWLKFIAIQLVMLVATLLGWFLLIPFCLAQAWKPSFRLATLRDTDRWSWEPLNTVYGNLEDGVSGQQALVWLNGDTQGPYMPGAWAPWRAYCWSALRNSCDNLKYVFAGAPGEALPLLTFKLFGRTCKAGWQMEMGHNVPVLSL